MVMFGSLGSPKIRQLTLAPGNVRARPVTLVLYTSLLDYIAQPRGSQLFVVG